MLQRGSRCLVARTFTGRALTNQAHHFEQACLLLCPQRPRLATVPTIFFECVRSDDRACVALEEGVMNAAAVGVRPLVAIAGANLRLVHHQTHVGRVSFGEQTSQGAGHIGALGHVRAAVVQLVVVLLRQVEPRHQEILAQLLTYG